MAELQDQLLVKIFGDDFIRELDKSPSMAEPIHVSPAKSHLESLSPNPIKKARRLSDSSQFEEPQKDSSSSSGPSEHKSISNLSQAMKSKLEELEAIERMELDSLVITREGRLGPSVVKYDVGSHVGSFIISSDRLGVNSQCNFGSIKACSCVFKGKWMYEVQLGSNGVMQIGWATVGTKFSSEKGVGDTTDSFAYDGNRLRKWNRSTSQYGETWQAGDIIGCCIDLDDGKIEFWRNGKSLGIAFSDISRGPGISYFPAVSLAYQENIIANFGATPLQFPVEGHTPLQPQQTSANTKSHLLLHWLENTLQYHMNADPASHNTLLLITSKIIEQLGPHLFSGFVVEQSFFPFFARVIGLPQRVSHQDSFKDMELDLRKSGLLLDLLWTYLEDSEMKSCLERTLVVVLNQFRSNSLSLNYSLQHYSLLCLIAFCSHRQTRRHLIRNLLFDRSCRLMQFLHVRPMDETILTEIIPSPWWPGKSSEESAESVSYNGIIKSIKTHVEEMERLQVSFLKILLTNTDGTETRPSTRSIFLKKFRNHTRDVVRPGSVLHQPIQKSLCTFFAFLKTIKDLSREELNSDENPSMLPSTFYDTSIQYFDMSRIGGLASFLYRTHHLEVSQSLSIPDYIPAPTVPSQLSTPGQAALLQQHNPNIPTIQVNTGVGSDQGHHLDTVTINIGQSVNVNVHVSPGASGSNSDENIGQPVTRFGALITGTPSGHNMIIPMMADFHSIVAERGFTFYPGFLGLASMDRNRSNSVQPHNPAVSLLGKDFGMMDPLFSLRELLDDTLIVFNAGVQASIEKVVQIRTNTAQYSTALTSTLSKYTTANPEEKLELEQSIQIFRKKLDDNSRHQAWIKAAVFTKERQQLVHELLKTVLNCLTIASTQGCLFTFVPEFYVSSLIQLSNVLISQFHPTIQFQDCQGLDETLTTLTQFISTHFSDPRIVIAETKDTLTQALSTFFCNRTLLNSLERMDSSSQISMIKSIIRPYEARAWAMSNYLLVRIWQGDGFAFQYPNSGRARRSFRAKPVQDEFGIETNLPPTPSKVFQNHIKSILLSDQALASSYLHSVLNQLNWAFSEFVGLVQEIHTASIRPEKVFIESRQLKICSTCFELTYSLLRVIEMVVVLARPVLTDFSRENAETLLSRLAMLLSQVLNRIGSVTGSFSSVVDLDIPGLENVTFFPLLSAVSGILVGLLQPELDNLEPTDIPATRGLINEPSFQPTSLKFLTGKDQTNPVFSLLSHTPEDVTQQELERLERVIQHVQNWAERLNGEEELNEENICTICYAAEQNAVLKPCNHRTCKTCIMHHLMNRQECFFCKTHIQKVYLDDGSLIHESTIPAVSALPPPAQS